MCVCPPANAREEDKSPASLETHVNVRIIDQINPTSTRHSGPDEVPDSFRCTALSVDKRHRKSNSLPERHARETVATANDLNGAHAHVAPGELDSRRARVCFSGAVKANV